MELKDVEIYKQIDEILWLEWDPLGVNCFEEARDEYYSYLPMVFELKKQDADAVTIAKVLYRITVERMGLLGDMGYCLSIANKIIAIE
ncbi:MAG: hypothetical protein ABI687_05355 [Flavitalea sp.]